MRVVGDTCGRTILQCDYFLHRLFCLGKPFSENFNDRCERGHDSRKSVDGSVYPLEITLESIVTRIAIINSFLSTFLSRILTRSRAVVILPSRSPIVSSLALGLSIKNFLPFSSASSSFRGL